MQNKKTWNRQKSIKRWRTKILKSHYLWCKKEGRDTSWYERHH